MSKIGYCLKNIFKMINGKTMFGRKRHDHLKELIDKLDELKEELKDAKPSERSLDLYILCDFGKYIINSPGLTFEGTEAVLIKLIEIMRCER